MEMSESLFNTRSSLIFSIVFSALLSFHLGLGLHLILVFAIAVPLANLFFLKWHRGLPSKTILGIFGRAVLLFLAGQILTIMFIIIATPGQLGYGASLKFDGSHITTLGYQTIATEIGILAIAAFCSACFTSFLFYRRN
jgi:hypothetical protein